jgi:TonB family protein
VKEKHNHIDQLTEEVLAAYRSGLLNTEQQHQVERLMLDDPFYAHALEGMESIEKTDLNADLKELEARLKQKTQQTALLPFWSMSRKIAATVVILLTSSLFFIWIQKPEEDKKVFSEKIEKLKRPAMDSIQLINPDLLNQPSLTASKLNTKPNQFQPIDPLAKIEASEIPIVVDEMEEIVISTQTEALTQPALMMSSAVKAELKTAETSEIMTNRALVEQKAKQEVVRSMDLRSTLQGRVAGVRIDQQLTTVTVVDADDLYPLPQVTIYNKNTIEGSRTDAEGKAEIVADSSAIYVVRFLGYLTQEFEFKNLSIMKDTIRMPVEVSSLGEVVVTGFGSSDQSSDASLINGSRDFKKYLKQNLNYPEAAREKKIRGRVTVAFVVNSDDKLSDFEIIQGLGYGCDEEAIRLIKKGPRWKAALGKTGSAIRTKVQVKIQFKP